MAIWGKITPLRVHFQNSSIKVQFRTTIDVFPPNFMLICFVTKKCEFTVPVTNKLPPFSLPFCAPLAQGAKILTREI